MQKILSLIGNLLIRLCDLDPLFLPVSGAFLHVRQFSLFPFQFLFRLPVILWILCFVSFAVFVQIGDLLIQPCDLDPLFLPVSGAFLHVRQFSLFPFQFLFRLPVIVWILCFVSFAVFVQSVPREVESEESVRPAFRYLVFVLERKACMILSSWALAYCHRLENIRFRHLSMLLHLDLSDLRQFQIAFGQEDVLIDADGRIAVLFDLSDLRQFQIAFGQEDVLIDADGRIAVLSVLLDWNRGNPFFG